jgi:hypothetical protein
VNALPDIVMRESIRIPGEFSLIQLRWKFTRIATWDSFPSQISGAPNLAERNDVSGNIIPLKSLPEPGHNDTIVTLVSDSRSPTVYRTELENPGIINQYKSARSLVFVLMKRFVEYHLLDAVILGMRDPPTSRENRISAWFMS